LNWKTVPPNFTPCHEEASLPLMSACKYLHGVSPGVSMRVFASHPYRWQGLARGGRSACAWVLQSWKEPCTFQPALHKFLDDYIN